MNIELLQQSRKEQKIQYCMHGLGAYKGLRQTNSKEAFLYWYSESVRLFEIDIAQTADGEYVAVAHSVDRKAMYRMEIAEIPASYNYKWFMKQELFPLTTGGLTPLSLDDVIGLLEEYDDCVFILDLFGLFSAQETQRLVTRLKELIHHKPVYDRLLVEVYNNEMADAVCQARDLELLFCVRYEGNLGNNAYNTEYLKDKGIRCISYPWKYTDDNYGEIEKYAGEGFIVFSRTKYNDKEYLLKKCGITVNIVDCVFCKALFSIEWVRYMLCCIKRMVSKHRMSKLIAK